MSTVAGPVVDTVLRRVRDDEGQITSRNFVRARISDSQRLINALTTSVLVSTEFQAEPQRCFYPLSPILGGPNKVVCVQEGPRDLNHVPWPTFWCLHGGWVRTFASQYELWSQIGKDVLVVWPATLKTVTLELLSVKNTDDLVNDDAVFELPDDLVPLITDLATALVLLKQRTYEPMAEVIATLKGRLADRVASIR